VPIQTHWHSQNQASIQDASSEMSEIADVGSDLDALKQLHTFELAMCTGKCVMVMPWSKFALWAKLHHLMSKPTLYVRT